MRLACLGALVLAPLAYAAPQVQALPASGEPPVDLAHWRTLDFEARWVLVAKSPLAKERWIAFLADQAEGALLEWIAISDGWALAGPALVNAKSPRWIRAACWNLANTDSHTKEGAEKALFAQAPLVLDWLDKNEAAAREGPVTRLLPSLAAHAKGVRGDAKGFEPALDPQVVLRDLDPPERVVEFGDRPRVQPGRVYLHQVQRAIGAMFTGGRIDDPWRAKLLRLTSHREPAVRQVAYLAFTRLPADRIPFDTFLARSRQAESADERAWALLALSYADHPAVLFELHAAAADASTPRAAAALSRLGEIGNVFSAEELRASLPLAARGPTFEAVLAAIEQREREANSHTVLRDLRPLLERAAWAEVGELPRAAALGAWTRQAVGRFRTDATIGALEALRDGYRAPERHGPAELREKLTSRVRAMARAILDAR